MEATLKTSRKSIAKTPPLLLLLLSCAVIAGTVTVNGVTYECQHTCNVHTYPNGGTMITDSQGGWIRRLPRMQ